MRLRSFLIALFFLSPSHIISAQIIKTIAGSGTLLAGYSGDGGPATNALINNPYGVITDKAHNVYIADHDNNVIRIIDTGGIINNFAGNHQPGYSGDGGPAVLAKLDHPTYFAIDNAGNLYFIDQDETVIRKISNSGIITSLTGNLPPGYSGDGGPLSQAKFSRISGITIDAIGNMYISDGGNNVIREVDTSGIITTIAGTGVAGFSGDGGPATSAQLNDPYAVATDSLGNIYIPENLNYIIRKIDPGGFISTFAGTPGVPGYNGDGGLAIDATFQFPRKIAIYNGIMYVMDPAHHLIRKIESDIVYRFAGNGTGTYSGDGGPALLAGMGGLKGMTIDDIGNIYLTHTLGSPSPTGITPSGLRKIIGCVTAAINRQPASVTTCVNGSVHFSISTINSPRFQWQVRTGSGWNDLANNSTYSGTATDTLHLTGAMLSMNNYEYRCIITNACGDTVSQAATLTVSAVPFTPSINIATINNNICSGTTVLFTSTQVNGGNSPSYLWKKNGAAVGTNSDIYVAGNFANGDVVTCTLASSSDCVTANTVNSNAIIMNVSPSVPPSVTITSSTNSICPAQAVIYTAVITNAGALPSYEWKKNNTIVGSNSNSCIDSVLVNGDIITCKVTAGNSCVAVPSSVSNAITMNVFNKPTIPLNHSHTLCTGTTGQLDAGIFSSYLWNDGTTARTLPVSTPGTYYVTVVDKNGCKGSDTTNITDIVSMPFGFLPGDTSVCDYGSVLINAKPGYNKYLWNTGSASAWINVTKPGMYWLEVTDNNNCKAINSLVVSGRECLKGFYIPNSFTPNNDGKNDVFKPFLFGKIKNFSFTIYNRFGQKVFATMDNTKGWEGAVKGARQDTDVFIWICTYQFENEPGKTERGTVLVTR